MRSQSAASVAEARPSLDFEHVEHPCYSLGLERIHLDERGVVQGRNYTFVDVQNLPARWRLPRCVSAQVLVGVPDRPK